MGRQPAPPPLGFPKGDIFQLPYNNTVKKEEEEEEIK